MKESKKAIKITRISFKNGSSHDVSTIDDIIKLINLLELPKVSATICLSDKSFIELASCDKETAVETLKLWDENYKR